MNRPSPSIEPIVGTFRIADGTRLADAAPCATALDPPPRAARGREGERLFILLDLTGPASPHLYRELREVVAQTYWSATSSITAALRRAAAAGNRYLFHTNLYAIPSDRCDGSLICAVSRDDDVFILQAGPARACFLHGEQLECFSRDRDPSPLGMARVADVHLHHTFIAPGDTLLLTTPALIREAGRAGLARVLPRAEVDEILAGLEQVGAGTNFAALVVRWALPSAVPRAEAPAEREAPRLLRRLVGGLRRPKVREAPEAPRAETPIRREVSHPLPPPSSELPRPKVREAPAEPLVEAAVSREVFQPLLRPRHEPPRLELREAPAALPTEAPAEFETSQRFPSREAAVIPDFGELGRDVQPLEPHEPPLPEPRARPELVREPGPSLGERLGGLKKGARVVGRGVAAAGMRLAGGVGTLFQRMLPGSGREARPRPRPSRPVPKENHAVMMAIAIGIPVVLAIVVALSYMSFGTQSRFQGLIKQAEDAVALAQASGGTTEEARPHWETALKHADAAIELRPDDQVATALQAQAQTALDLLDGIVRLQPIQLWDFGPSTTPRRLVVHGQMIFVLDPAGGWVTRLTLNPTGDSAVEQGDIPILVHEEQQIGEGKVGALVDFVWVDSAGERLTSGLLILEEDGALVSYDPAWESPGGTPQLKRFFLGTPPNSPSVAGSFEGRLYVLDTAINQIRRYGPRGDAYPDRPDYYFVDASALPRALAGAQDMAIDGNIYILYRDGTLLKFLRGEPQPFDVRGVPGGISQAVAMAVDPDGSSGAIYVADQGSEPGQGRVVVLESDGAFRAQLCADETFGALEALAVDEGSRQLYAISGGRLYVASLP